MKDRLASNLHPREVRVSPLFHAVLACLLGQTGWTSPELASLTVTCDGFLLGMRQGVCGFNDFLGSQVDLTRNLRGVAEAVGLTSAETHALLDLAPQEPTH